MAAWIEVYQVAFAEPPWNESWSREDVETDLRKCLSSPNPIVLVAEDAGRLVGFTAGYRTPFSEFPFLEGIVRERSSYMDEIAVLASMRGRGVGRSLGEAYLQAVVKQGMEQAVLRTDERNGASMALFRSLGFQSLEIWDPKYKNRIYLARGIENES